MDLRRFITNPSQIEEAKKLVIRGLLNYQPFIFADDFEVGSGYEFLYGEFSGLVCCPTIDETVFSKESPELRKFFIKQQNKEQFTEANAKLRVMYDNFVEVICNKIRNVSETTFADVGCSSGYFPISFSLRGAKDAVGYDRIDYALTFKLLNDILNAKARFVYKAYSGLTQRMEYPILHTSKVFSIDAIRKQTVQFVSRLIRKQEKFDVVISIAVLCHLSDPLQHLGFLGSIARKAIFIWAPVTDDDDYCIRYGEPNKYYKTDHFPLCFDSITRPSAKLLRKSLELMGFTEIYEIPNKEGGMPDRFYNVHKAILAIRP